MKRNTRLVRWLLLGAVASLSWISSTAFAQAGTAYGNPLSFGIVGGASIPLGDFADIAKTGWHAGALLQWNTPTLPFGVRLEGTYHKFGDKEEDLYPNLIAGVINVVWTIPMQGASTVRPYLIGGAGIYDKRLEGFDSQTKPGLNGGAGIVVPLSGFASIIEARFHVIFDSDTNRSNSTFVPISVGILFR